MASSKETYCLCGQPYNIGQFMIECDCCREWFHGSCVDVKIYQSDDIDKYHCPKCSETYGPSVLKIPTNNHRADRYEVGAETRAPQVGTPAWVRWLAARALRPVPAALQRMRPQQFTEEFVRDNGFTRPVMFHTTEGLDMKTPNPATFTVRSVLRFCGAQLEVEVIDVRKQATLRMPLGDFVDYFETPPEHRDEKVLNVLSLEFSDTNMSGLVEPPGVVRALDWAARVWPPAEPRPPRPAVHKYCLVSAAGAYTDFHIDFGGTTVWYHVLHGRKIFYLIPPTATNLALYQQWSASNNQNERFFGDMVEWYGTAEVCAGQTLVIPSGWVHAVLTPCDALVFGGNLLHSYAIETQLQIYEIERRVETPLVLRYPLFEALHWYAGAHLLSALRRHNEESQDEEFTLHEGSAACAPAPLPPLLLRGLRLLAAALKEWHALKSTDAAKRDNVPKCLNSGQLVRELARELRALDKRSAAASTATHKDSKQKNTTPNKSRRNNTKKSLKLTLPKPIMHMAHNGEFPDERVYAEKLFIDNKEVVFQDGRYVAPDMKYGNGLPETKYIIDSKEMVLPDRVYGYQGYEEMHSYPDSNGYVEHQDKKGHILKIKLNSSPSSSRAEAPPPPYPAEPSILKQQLVRPAVRGEHAAQRPAQQWTISKEDAGEYHEEQILFTNDNLHRVDAQEMSYGPGMYSAEDIQQDYQYSESAKPGSFQPTYGYQQPAGAAEVAVPQPVVTYVDHYQRYEELQLPAVHQMQGASYSAVPVPVPVQEPVPQSVPVPVAGPYQPAPLPTYDAAMAHQYGATTTDYVVEEALPAAAAAAAAAEPPAARAPVRRSVRPVRRRVSTTYDYEDGDLYIDDAPAPRRKPKPKHKHKHVYRHHAVPVPSAAGGSASVGAGAGAGAGGSGAYRAGRVAPANGIESLIQASVLAEEEPPPPDAVAGMLSISERYAPPRAFGLAQPPPSPPAPDHAHPGRHCGGTSGARAKRAGRGASAGSGEEGAQDEEDVIKEVHRDEEYVYPSLEMSSEEEAEEEEWARSKRRRSARARADTRGKADKDESWSPRARLGRLVPRLRGPGRAGVRRECVRAALHAAATHARPHAHPHPHPHPHPHAHARPHQPAHDAPVNAKRAVLASKSRRPPPPAHDTPNNKNIRLKKGMKTAKQRLGKILKLHKMMH